MQRIIAKYGLAAHLALLAAGPCALFPFLSAGWLAVVVYWLAALALLWLFLEPSILSGEHLSLARARVRKSIVRDPLFWLLVLASLGAAARCLNDGVALFYDAEKTEWLVREGAYSILPSAARGAATLPCAAVVGGTVLLLGLRHGLGLAARLSFGLVASLVAGLGGLAAVGMVCLGRAPFLASCCAELGSAQGAGSLFGVWLFVALASGAQAEARKWGASRLPFALAVGGNVAGLLFFEPPMVAGVWFAAAAFYALFALVQEGRAGSASAVARTTVFIVLGCSLAAFLLMALAPQAVRTAKAQGVNLAIFVPESVSQMSEVLSRIARTMWQKTPWCGVGVGAFGLHLPFLAEKGDWVLVPAEASSALNAYWTLLAERGILGCMMLVALFGALLWTWGARLAGAFLFLRTQDDADTFVFAVPSVVWAPLVWLPLVCAEALYEPVFPLHVLMLSVFAALALAASSFPKDKRKASEASAQTPAPENT